MGYAGVSRLQDSLNLLNQCNQATLSKSPCGVSKERWQWAIIPTDETDTGIPQHVSGQDRKIIMPAKIFAVYSPPNALWGQGSWLGWVYSLCSTV